MQAMYDLLMKTFLKFEKDHVILRWNDHQLYLYTIVPWRREEIWDDGKIHWWGWFDLRKSSISQDIQAAIRYFDSYTCEKIIRIFRKKNHSI